MGEQIYLAVVILLFVLAIADLMVGVSNDAVNFLNSAIGSKVSSRRVIMSVASAGIVVGALFSSGIMEVAQKGVFNPSAFHFHEVMIIFLAVMLTDIVLLDLFNTFGMPTSTTVSIIFELLGSAFMVGYLSMMRNEGSATTIYHYINSNSALTIILGIFLSVAIAFTIGGLIQFVSRVIFSFNYQRQFAKWGFIFTGLALSFLTYFMFIKGFKGASFIDEETGFWIENNQAILFGGALLFWIFSALIMQKALKLDLLKAIVFVGTFSLAMAFAGNDLVNFIGVAIAGLNAYLFWSVANAEPMNYLMVELSKPLQTNTLILLGAGLVMVFTLWLSKKAQSVTETEVNLARQGHGDERFSGNLLSRGLVNLAVTLNQIYRSILPNKWLKAINNSFKPMANQAVDAPAFDLIRASINLTVASMLIALATSLKLPLSTTYVSFMVAMGTSLADRAWGSASAENRVAGVLSVVGGWFLTAFIAFLAAAFIAALLSLSLWFAVLVIGGVVLSIVYSNKVHTKRTNS